MTWNIWCSINVQFSLCICCIEIKIFTNFVEIENLWNFSSKVLKHCLLGFLSLLILIPFLFPFFFHPIWSFGLFCPLSSFLFSSFSASFLLFFLLIFLFNYSFSLSSLVSIKFSMFFLYFLFSLFQEMLRRNNHKNINL